MFTVNNLPLLRYCAPIPVVLVLHSPQMFPKKTVIGRTTLRVGLNYFTCHIAHILQQLLVACKIGNLQVERDTALLCSLNISGATQLQVGLCYHKPVVAACHTLHTLAGIL